MEVGGQGAEEPISPAHGGAGPGADGRAGWQQQEYGDWLLGRSEATRRAYLGDLESFCRWAGRTGCTAPGGVDRIVLRRYLAYLSTRGYARATVARKAAALRTYFDWCRRRGLVGEDPSRRLSSPGAGGRLPAVLSRRELEVLLESRDAGARARPRARPAGSRGGGRGAAQDALAAAYDLRDDAVLELLYAAGLRVSELCGLDGAGVDLRARAVTVMGKGAKERRCPCTRGARRLSGGGWRRDGPSSRLPTALRRPSS